MNDYSSKVLIIGAGQIGSRHLQSLSKLNHKLNVSVIDNNPKSIDAAKAILDEMPVNKHLFSVNYYGSLDNINGQYDIAIIATNADIRKKVIKEVLKRSEIKYCILEKIVCQSIKDFKEILNLFKKHDIKSWVNCNRRLYPLYKSIKEKISTEYPIDIFIDGGNWDLACNSIHFIDLFSYFSGQLNISINSSKLDKQILDSKRSGFIEFTGRLICTTNRGDSLIMNSSRFGDKPMVIYLASKDQRYYINEYIDGNMYSKGKVISSFSINDWSWEENNLRMPFVSDLTCEAVNQILDTGNCDLPDINDSFKQHKPLIESLNNHLKMVTNNTYDICPIT